MTKQLQLSESCIKLEALPFFSHHGVLPEERRDGGYFRLSIVLYFSASTAMHSDDVADTINYAVVYQLLEKEMAQPSNLLEHVVYRILNTLGEKFDQLTRATCTLTKVKPPIPGFEGAGATFTATVDYV